MKNMFIGFMMMLVSMTGFAKTPYKGEIYVEFSPGMGMEITAFDFKKNDQVVIKMCGRTDCVNEYRGKYDPNGMCYYSKYHEMPVCMFINRKEAVMTDEDGYILNTCVDFGEVEIPCRVKFD